jgi:hypothetical protein
MNERLVAVLLQAQRMERTVSGISGMIGEFAALVAAQSELVDGIDRCESSYSPSLSLRHPALCIIVSV